MKKSRNKGHTKTSKSTVTGYNDISIKCPLILTIFINNEQLIISCSVEFEHEKSFTTMGPALLSLLTLCIGLHGIVVKLFAL